MRFETTTARLRLRRPVEADLDFHVALHSDPRLYTHAPHALRAAREDNEDFFRSVLRHWDEHGFGYWTVEGLETGVPIGMAGVRSDDGCLNLYYRLSLDAHGRGYAREAAREAVALATEWLPGMPVRAFAREHNIASVRTAEAAGLAKTGPFTHRDDPPGEPPSVMLESPTVARSERVGNREEVLDLWCRVNDTGGSVGFLPGADRGDVSSALARHESDMDAGLAVLGELRGPAGELLGLGWWVRSPSPMMAHGMWLYRLMVDPLRQGQNLGRILLAGLHRIAREIPGVDLVTLDYRSGHGLGGFYERCGYTEVGRIPGAVRVGPGDDRDDVYMSMRLDGGPLRFDART